MSDPQYPAQGLDRAGDLDVFVELTSTGNRWVPCKGPQALIFPRLGRQRATFQSQPFYQVTVWMPGAPKCWQTNRNLRLSPLFPEEEAEAQSHEGTIHAPVSGDESHSHGLDPAPRFPFLKC